MLTAACSKENPKPNGQEQTTPEEDDGEEGNGRYLVLYCSRTGNTERMAQTIQSTLGNMAARISEWLEDLGAE